MKYVYVVWSPATCGVFSNRKDAVREARRRLKSDGYDSEREGNEFEIARWDGIGDLVFLIDIGKDNPAELTLARKEIK